MFGSISLLRSFGVFRTFILQRCHPYEVKFMPGSRFQNLVAAEVTRLKHSENQSLLTSAATVLKEPQRVASLALVTRTRMLQPLQGWI